MNLSQAFSFPFSDEQWASKLGLGTLISLCPILNFASLGYELETMRRVSADDPQPLPDWDQLSRFFNDGLWLVLARLVYGLPATLLGGCLFVTFMGGLGTVLSLAQTDQAAQIGLGTLAILCCSILAALWLYQLFFGLLAPAVTLQYFRQRSFGACFNFGAIWRFISHNLSGYLTLWLSIVVFQLVGTLIVIGVVLGVSLIPCVGAFISLLYPFLLGGLVFYTQIFSGHLLGQLLRAGSPTSQ